MGGVFENGECIFFRRFRICDRALRANEKRECGVAFEFR